MSSRLFNVRLDEELARKLAKLRADGLTFKELVRGAIETHYAKRTARRKPRDIDSIMAKLDAEYPIGVKNLPRRTYSVHDRQQAAAAIQRLLTRKRQAA